jgi:flagellar basal-body rod protein FlgB
MSEISQALAVKAMDGLMLRQSAIAENIANSNSETFAVRSVNYEAALREAAAQGPEAVKSLVMRIESVGPRRPGDTIRLDLEMQSSAATAMRYSALADLLGRQMQISRAAVRGGQ